MGYLMEDLRSIPSTSSVLSVREMPVVWEVIILKKLPISKHQYYANHTFQFIVYMYDRF
jgi:hypothetical protein